MGLWDRVKTLRDPLVLSHHPFTLVELYFTKHIMQMKMH